MRRPVLSSEIYELSADDVSVLPDAGGDAFSDDGIVILLGRNPRREDSGNKDVLLCGRALLDRAVKNGSAFVPVRLAFVPANSRFDFLSPFIRNLRNRIRFYGSNVYHVRPQDIRALKIERTFKTRENAYSFTKSSRRMTRAERDAEYDRIAGSIKENGFRDSDPIDIMLCRLTGSKDCVDNGHHRMGIALDLGLDKIPVRFCAAAAAPAFLRPLMRLFSTLNLAFKRRFGH